MEEDTPRFALPMLAAGQAQKELTHNEALARLDIALQTAVEEMERDDPPIAPVVGACWIVGSTPTGAWAGHERTVAGWTDGGWRFVAPREGMRVWDKAGGQDVRYDETAGWIRGRIVGSLVAIAGVQVLGSQQPAIDAPAGGDVVDVQARMAITSIVDAMRSHGLIAT